MRFQFSSVLRTLYTLSSFTRARAAQQQQNPLLQRVAPLRSMPSIPLLGSLFGTKAADSAKMSKSYPDQRTDDEWRAVLNPGMSSPSQQRFPPFPTSCRQIDN